MTEELFDLSDEYEAMLNQGIRLSGEDMFFFLEGRLAALAARTQDRNRVRSVLDFGCGLGYASKRLSEIFPHAQITGIDTSDKALEAAQERNGGANLRFLNVNDLRGEGGAFDLCYVNGVFHHIPPAEREVSLSFIHRLLRPDGGALALFENNPWNFGARMVMSRIPFDRDASMLSPRLAASLLRRTGFKIQWTDSLFFFPRWLSGLRPVEPLLSWTRLGAQYLVVGAKK